MNILTICREWEQGAMRTLAQCETYLGADCHALIIDDSYSDMSLPGIDPDYDAYIPAISAYYTLEEEAVFKPDVILAYGDVEENIAIEPRCPVVKMGQKYAVALWLLPDTDDFERSFPLNPEACKVMFDNDDMANHAEKSGDVFDVWVFKNFNAFDVSCAMAWGCIPLVPADTGASDWIAHGITGLLYNSNLERDMFVDELKNDPMLRRDLSTAARQWVYEHADIKILENLLDRIKGL